MKKLSVLLLLFVTTVCLFGCSGPKVPVEDIAAEIKEAIKEHMIAGGIPEEQFENGLPGYIEADILEEGSAMWLSSPDLFDEDTIDEGVILASMFNVNSDEILIVKAKDKRSVKDLLVAMETEKENRLRLWETYLPNQYEKVKNTVIKSEGLYLLYATYKDPEVVEGAFQSALKGK